MKQKDIVGFPQYLGGTDGAEGSWKPPPEGTLQVLITLTIEHLSHKELK